MKYLTSIYEAEILYEDGGHVEHHGSFQELKSMLSGVPLHDVNTAAENGILRSFPT